MKLAVTSSQLRVVADFMDIVDSKLGTTGTDVQDDLRQLAQQVATLEAMPTITCLVGSTRFADEFQRQNLRLTLEGKIVLSIGANVSDATLGIPQDSEVKLKLDELHFWKIQLADEVFCINVGGYIGTSTRNELNFARSLGKPITYLEEVFNGADRQPAEIGK